VLLDAGVCRGGGDVVNALTLGVRAVTIGPAYLRGLAGNGQADVENVLDILRAGIDSALLGPGHACIADPNRSGPVIPDLHPQARHRRHGSNAPLRTLRGVRPLHKISR
jgi:isopentenyl diphosphate isomerase/L-lactate dehydrogenase-like FMN-dependent dehydrogenase